MMPRDQSMRGRVAHRGAAALAVVMIAMATLAVGTTRADEAKLVQQIDRLVRPYIDEPIAAGLVVGVIQGETSLVRGYGKIDRDKPATPNGKTIYEIGSITKTFTGLLLADAAVSDRVDLNQPIRELLPEGIKTPQHGDTPIRLKHLATHVSGLPRMPDDLGAADTSDPYADYATEDLHAFLSGFTPQRAPEQTSEYSNLAFGLLGELLASQAELSYGALLKQRITQPLGMRDTTVEVTGASQRRLAAPYDGNLNRQHSWNFQAFAGAGAIRSTADDMLRYARAHLEPPAGPVGEAIELAWRVHQQPLAEDDFAVGLGWHVARDGATRWHNGQTGGYHSMLLINRPKQTAVVVLSNTATGEIDTLAEQLFRMLLGVVEQPREFPKSTEVTLEQMQRLVGRYELVPSFVLTVRIEDDALMVGATGQPFYQVFPESPTKWNYRVVPASLTFEGATDLPASAVVLHQNGLDQRARRIE